MRKLLSLLFVCFSIASYAQLCAGSTGTINAPNPQSLGNPQYSLNPGGFFPISGTNQFAVTPSATTNYTVYTTGTNSANVVVTTSLVLTVTVLPQPILTPTVIQPSCSSTIAGFNLNLTWLPASPVPTYAIAWSSIPNGITSAQTTSLASGIAAGPYTATIVANGGCGYIASFTVNPPPAPANFSLTPFAQTMTLNCITPTIDITASNSSLSYTWASSCTAPVSGTNAVNLSSVCLGTYTITGKNENSGCTKTMTFTLVQDIKTPTLSATPLFQSITCTAGAVTCSLTSSPTINVAFYATDPFGGVLTANSHTAIFSPVIGQTTVELVNLVNGCKATKIVTVTSAQGFPTYTVQSPSNFTVGCNSKSVAVVNINNATGSTPGAPVSYTIIGPGTGTVVPSTGTLSGQQTYSLTQAGQYTVIVREAPSFCDTRSNMSILAYTNSPNISTTQDYLVLDCNHTVTTLYGSSETPNVSYNWGYLNFNVPSSTVASQASLAATSNTVVNIYTLTITDNSSTCKSTSVVTIYQNLYPPKAQFAVGSASLSCKTPTITLTNISTTTIKTNSVLTSNAGPVIGYIWLGPTPQTSLALSTTYFGYVPGVYTITAKDMINGCVATATQNVDDYKEFAQIQFTKSYSLDCGTPIFLDPSYTTVFSTTQYSWAPYKDNFPMPANVNVPILKDVLYSGNYSVTVNNADNGCITGGTVHVASSIMNAVLDASTLEGYAPLTVSLTNNSASSVGTSTGITSYYSLGNGTYSTTPSTSIAVTPVYLHPGTYSLALTVLKGGCRDTVVKTVRVLLPSKIEVPNVFTPNGDGINDVYFLNAASLSDVTFTINDRWGHLVYEVTSTTGNILWDGKNQAGVEVSEGTYFYVLKASGKDGQTFDDKGTIQLIR